MWCLSRSIVGKRSTMSCGGISGRSSVRWPSRRNVGLKRGHLMGDHVHMLLSIPPKYSVAQVVGFIKGKAAIHIARTFMGRRKNYTGHHFWARGYYVSTVGRDEAVIREYIRTQEAEDRRLDQMDLW